MSGQRFSDVKTGEGPEFGKLLDLPPNHLLVTIFTILGLIYFSIIFFL